MAQINKEFLERLRAELSFYKEKAKQSTQLEVSLQEKERELEKVLKENQALKEETKKYHQQSKPEEEEDRKKLLKKIQALEKKLEEINKKNKGNNVSEEKRVEKRKEDWFFRNLQEANAIDGKVEPQAWKEYILPERRKKHHKNYHFLKMDDSMKKE